MMGFQCTKLILAENDKVNAQLCIHPKSSPGFRQQYMTDYQRLFLRKENYVLILSYLLLDYNLVQFHHRKRTACPL